MFQETRKILIIHVHWTPTNVNDSTVLVTHEIFKRVHWTPTNINDSMVLVNHEIFKHFWFSSPMNSVELPVNAISKDFLCSLHVELTTRIDFLWFRFEMKHISQCRNMTLTFYCKLPGWKDKSWGVGTQIYKQLVLVCSCDLFPIMGLEGIQRIQSSNKIIIKHPKQTKNIN